jgi:adenine-specific DNA-methyltransferase
VFGYVRDRLVVARDLLTESGSLFVQIGDENVHLVRCVLDEVFGSECVISLIAFKKTSAVGSFGGGKNVIPGTCDYVAWYCKDKDRVKYRQLFREKDLEGAGGEAYRSIEMPNGERRPSTPDEMRTGVSEGLFFRPRPITSITVREARTTVFPVELGGRTFLPGGNRGWSTNKSGMENLKVACRLMFSGNSLAFVRYLEDFPVFPVTNLWSDTQSGSSMEKIYAVQTNTKVIERCIFMTTDPGDLIFDPTCGSGTTAYVAEQWGRRWITCDTSRVALALARTRLMARRGLGIAGAHGFKEGISPFP